MIYDIVTKLKPKWYQLRWQLARFFIFLAKECYHESPEVRAFLMKIAVDKMIYGKAITVIDPQNFIPPKGNRE
jgi:hypothetical protein